MTVSLSDICYLSNRCMADTSDTDRDRLIIISYNNFHHKNRINSGDECSNMKNKRQM